MAVVTEPESEELRKIQFVEQTVHEHYERELSDAELVVLTTSVIARTSALLSQGANLPMQTIENHHVIGLLEALLGPEESLLVKEWHLTWLDRMLDQVEGAMRAHLLATGIFDAGPSSS